MTPPTPSLSPLNTNITQHPRITQHDHDRDMTPTPSTPQADYSPHLITPEVRLIDSISPKRKRSPEDSVQATSPRSPRTRLLVESGMVSAEPLPSSTRLQNTFFNAGLPSSPYISKESILSPNRSKMLPRRQSRFDPMMRESDDIVEDDGYGDLGQKHPLRRVQEEDGRDLLSDEPVSLPGIKSLFGVAGDHPTTPSTSTLFQTPSLPSLIPNSPSSSPNSARTSRYSSLASSTVPENQAGWWAPEFEKGSPFHSSPFRSSSFPTTVPYTSDALGQKRRRSDGPPATRDPEESARLKWQAQSRNASYPSSYSSVETQTGSASGHGLRGLLHPPQASSAALSASMSRSSYSDSTSGIPLSPTMENNTLPPLTRPPGTQSRNPSLVGGQLSRHFADLSASDRPSASPSYEMPPPFQTGPERRPSILPPLSAVDDNRLLVPPTSLSRSSSPGSDSLRRHSLTRPPSPEAIARPELRRSSLTEIIMAKSGDSLTMTKGRFHPPPSELASVAMEKPSFSEPGPPVSSHHALLPWRGRRESTESVKSASGLTDHEGPLLALRGRKRSAADVRKAEEDDAELEAVDPAMRGMEVLVAAVAEEERKVRKSSEEDREGSPKGGNGTTGGPKYTCAFCAKTFSRPSSLRIHTYSHTGERPYVCKEPTCRRRFSVQSNLKRHAKVHQLGAAGPQGAAGHPHQLNGHPHGHAHGHGPVPPHPGMVQGPPGMLRGPHAHPGPAYHPQPPPGYYPPGPGYGPPHPLAHPGQPGQAYRPYPERFGPPGPGMHGPPLGYGSANTSRRTSRDGEWSGEEEGEAEDEEEIDELDEED